MIRRNPARSVRILRRDRRGAAAVEFALVVPVMMMFMMGIGDLLYGIYANAIVFGAVQKAGRDSTLQMNASTTATTAIDEKVMVMVKKVAPAATYVSSRKNYTTFSNVDKPEPHTDVVKAGNTAGVRDAGECYSDTNGNGSYDLQGGRVGIGGANDIAQYTITVTYPRVFPVARLLGWGTTGTITVQTVLKNQPYAAQATVATICT
jgi:Flp pilus assembly protein TadG